MSWNQGKKRERTALIFLYSCSASNKSADGRGISWKWLNFPVTSAGPGMTLIECGCISFGTSFPCDRKLKEKQSRGTNEMNSLAWSSCCNKQSDGPYTFPCNPLNWNKLLLYLQPHILQFVLVLVIGGEAGRCVVIAGTAWVVCIIFMNLPHTSFSNDLSLDWLRSRGVIVFLMPRGSPILVAGSSCSSRPPV